MRIKVLADVSFRARNPNWSQEARGLIEAASDYYEREFDIRLVSQSVSPWPEKERIPSTPELLARLKKEWAVSGKNDGYDLIVLFTAEGVSRILTTGRPRVDRIGNCTEGLANYVIVPVTRVFRYRGPNANQCLSCHAQDGRFMPLGPPAGHRNREFHYPNCSENQLA